MRLLKDDCLKCLRELPDNSIDMTVTSPPYDDIRTYNGHIGQWSFEKFQEIAKRLYRVTKEGGVVVWIVNDMTKNGSETGTSFRHALYAIETGFRLHDTMIWNKGCFSYPDKNRYLQVFEYMFIFSKGAPKSFHAINDRKNKFAGTKSHGTWRQRDGSIKPKSGEWVGKRYAEYGKRFNVWELPNEKNNTTGHPAVFPVSLVRDHIITWSNDGDTVLDPFMGSGTTGVAARKVNRDFIGIEIDDQYFEIAKERIEGETAQVNIFDVMKEAE